MHRPRPDLGPRLRRVLFEQPTPPPPRHNTSSPRRRSRGDNPMCRRCGHVFDVNGTEPPVERCR